jgi:hypothetical protein
MKGLLALCALGGAMLVVPASQTLAQSGVISGPPQYRPNKDTEAGSPPAGLSSNARPSPQGAAWIAVVGGFDGNGGRVSVGYSTLQRSQYEAEDAAVKACRRNQPSSIQCRQPFAVSSGCLYIVPGNRPGGGVTWGRGGTRQAALSECRRGGYTCADSKIIGGCVPGSN